MTAAKSDMDERTREHLERLLSHEKDLHLRHFEKSLKAISAECSVKGLYGSGPMIRMSLNAAAETSAKFLAAAVPKVKEIARGSAAFSLLRNHVEDLLAILEARLPTLVWPPNGNSPYRKRSDGTAGTGEHASEYKAAKKIMARTQTDRETELKIAEFDFVIDGGDEATVARRSEASTAAVGTNRSRGRPLGSSRFASDDATLVEEMKRMLKDGTAASRHHAAQIVAERAAGPSTVDSKVRRLERAFAISTKND